MSAITDLFLYITRVYDILQRQIGKLEFVLEKPWEKPIEALEKKVAANAKALQDHWDIIQKLLFVLGKPWEKPIADLQALIRANQRTIASLFGSIRDLMLALVRVEDNLKTFISQQIAEAKKAVEKELQPDIRRALDSLDWHGLLLGPSPEVPTQPLAAVAGPPGKTYTGEYYYFDDFKEQVIWDAATLAARQRIDIVINVWLERDVALEVDERWRGYAPSDFDWSTWRKNIRWVKEKSKGQSIPFYWHPRLEYNASELHAFYQRLDMPIEEIRAHRSQDVKKEFPQAYSSMELLFQGLLDIDDLLHNPVAYVLKVLSVAAAVFYDILRGPPGHPEKGVANRLRQMLIAKYGGVPEALASVAFGELVNSLTEKALPDLFWGVWNQAKKVSPSWLDKFSSKVQGWYKEVRGDIPDGLLVTIDWLGERLTQIGGRMVSDGATHEQIANYVELYIEKDIRDLIEKDSTVPDEIARMFASAIGDEVKEVVTAQFNRDHDLEKAWDRAAKEIVKRYKLYHKWTREPLQTLQTQVGYMFNIVEPSWETKYLLALKTLETTLGTYPEPIGGAFFATTPVKPVVSELPRVHPQPLPQWLETQIEYMKAEHYVEHAEDLELETAFVEENEKILAPWKEVPDTEKRELKDIEAGNWPSEEEVLAEVAAIECPTRDIT